MGTIWAILRGLPRSLSEEERTRPLRPPRPNGRDGWSQAQCAALTVTLYSPPLVMSSLSPLAACQWCDAFHIITVFPLSKFRRSLRSRLLLMLNSVVTVKRITVVNVRGSVTQLYWVWGVPIRYCVYVACREYDYHRLATREVVGLKRFEPLWGLSPPTNPVFPKANPNVKSHQLMSAGDTETP